jgi:RES domain-containing protein
MVYTAESQSLAALELLVHLDSPSLLDQYAFFQVTIEEWLILRLDLNEWPREWRGNPPPARLQEIGDAWAEAGKSAVLQVPSAVVPDESNFLLNPKHPEFGRIHMGRATPFRYDPRLTRR